MNTKAEHYNKFLKEKEIKCFQVQEVESNEMHPVVFDTAMEISGQNLPTRLVIDDSIYVMLQVRVAATVVKESNRAAVQEHLNKLNETYKVFKYYVDDVGSVFVESCVPATDDGFAPELVQAIVNVVYEHLNEEYPKIMKVVWSD